MKLFEQLKSNASRMAVYAILVATALCGIAAPVYALNGKGEQHALLGRSCVLLGFHLKYLSGRIYIANSISVYITMFKYISSRLNALS